MTRALLCFLMFTTAATAGDYNGRRVSYHSNSKRQLFYFSGGSYYYYEGGSHGQLYYWQDGAYHEYHSEKIVLVPKAIEVEVHRDHYYSINTDAQNSLLADAIVGRLILLQQARGSSSGTPKTAGPAAVGEPKAGAYQNADLLALVNESCAKCHDATSKNTRLITADGKSLNDLPAGKVWECFGLVNSGEMPKGGKAIANERVKLFYDWAKNARKSNEKVSLVDPGSRPGRRSGSHKPRGPASSVLRASGSGDFYPASSVLRPSGSGDFYPAGSVLLAATGVQHDAADLHESSSADLHESCSADRVAAAKCDRFVRRPAAADHRAAAAADHRAAAAADRGRPTAADHRAAAAANRAAATIQRAAATADRAAATIRRAADRESTYGRYSPDRPI